MYAYVRARQLEGNFSDDPQLGAWIVTDLRIRKGWGSPPESEWPYEPHPWPPVEPPGIDDIAKRRRLFAYGRVRTLDDFRRLLTEHQPIAVAVEIDDTWHSTSDGQLGEPAQHSSCGAHSVLVVGYRDSDRDLIFANSWGPGWGDNGYGYMPYSYVEERLLEAWFIDPVWPSRANHSESGITITTRGVTDRLGRLLHLCQITDRDADEPIGWSLTVETTDGLEVEELFVRPAYRGQGYGRTLADELVRLRTTRAQPLIAWIPHTDAGAPIAQNATLRHAGLERRNTNLRWASGVATAS